MTPIQRSPDWLRQFLRVYGDHPEPTVLVQELVPTLDLSAFYEADIGLEQVENIFGGVPTPGEGYAPVDVPAGEFWLVTNITSKLYASGGPLAFRFGPAMCGFPSATSPVWASLRDQLTVTLATAGDFWLHGHTFDKPMGFTSGWRFATAMGFASGGVSVRTAVTFLRLRSTG